MRRSDHVGVAFTDLLFNALLGFVVMFVLAFLLINPIAKSGAIDPKAEFLITLTWPDGRREDVDLYVEDPAGQLVWFRSREAGLMHLDRDDLGERNDVDRGRGPPRAQSAQPGDRLDPRHPARRIRREPPSLPRRRRPAGAGDGQDREAQSEGRARVLRAARPSTAQGDEQTAARFSLGADGRVRDLNQLPKQLVPLRRLASAATEPPP